MIGTRDGDYLFPTGIIDADEVSEGDLANYPDLDATWKKVFGSPLTAEFFTRRGKKVLAATKSR